MTKQEVENSINNNVQDNSFRAVTPTRMREVLFALNDKTEINIPILHDLITLPPDPSTPSLGWYNGLQYTWNVTTQGWVATGTGTSGVVTGTHTFTGDGITSSFSWAHGLGFNPTATGYTIDPVTATAQGVYSKSADGTNFYVNYDLCPVGTITFNTTVKQP